MTQLEINHLETFLKGFTYERNGKKYSAKVAFTQAYANCSISKLMARDYYQMVHPWFAIRYAFDWAKDRYNLPSFWKDVNHSWEEYCIKKKIATIDELRPLSVDELKAITRDLFSSCQYYGDSVADAMEYCRIYIDEREERIRKEKEAEEAKLAAERLKHLENQKRHEEELRKKNEKAAQTINPVHVNSVIIDDDDDEDDDDYIILNSNYTRRNKISKGEIRIDNKGNNMLTFSSEDSKEFISKKLEYLCLKVDRETGTINLRVCNDSNRGVKMTAKEGTNILHAQSKILIDYLMKAFCLNSKAILKISSNESLNPKVISYRILGVKK